MIRRPGPVRPARARTALGPVLLVAALLVAGCGSASQLSPPTGVDGLTIPTPSPDPTDFVDEVDNPWLPLPRGATWTYTADVGDGAARRVEVRVEPGPVVAGVATTARVERTDGGPGGGSVEVSDLYAQDRAGNVWWFAHVVPPHADAPEVLGDGVDGGDPGWQAGEGGVRAGLAMAAAPRVGDGYRGAQGPDLDLRAEVVSRDGAFSFPGGDLDHLVVVRLSDPARPGLVRTATYARGLGLVSLATASGTPAISSVLETTSLPVPG